VTSRITHATPAAFSSHVEHRDQEYDIAYQQANNQSLDVLFGGGLEKYTSRPDGVNLLQVMQQRGYQTMTTLQGIT
jgi:alkaline phosphatase